MSTPFCVRSRAFLEPMVQVLRSASVGAEQTSPGRLAPHLLQRKRVKDMPTLFERRSRVCLDFKVQVFYSASSAKLRDMRE